MSLAADPPAAPPKHILVVECDSALARTVQMVLVRLGHLVDVAPGGEEAQRLFEPGKYDVITTAFELPGMNGLRLARALKDRCQTQPIILISGYAGSVRWSREDLIDVDAVVRKPFALAELMNAIARTTKR